MLFQCWASVEDGGPTLKQHRVNAPCLLGHDMVTSYSLNPLSPLDALKNIFTSLKTDLIFLQLMVFEWKFP